MRIRIDGNAGVGPRPFYPDEAAPFARPFANSEGHHPLGGQRRRGQGHGGEYIPGEVAAATDGVRFRAEELEDEIGGPILRLFFKQLQDGRPDGNAAGSVQGHDADLPAAAEDALGGLRVHPRIPFRGGGLRHVAWDIQSASHPDEFLNGAAGARFDGDSLGDVGERPEGEDTDGAAHVEQAGREKGSGGTRFRFPAGGRKFVAEKMIRRGPPSVREGAFALHGTIRADVDGDGGEAAGFE